MSNIIVTGIDTYHNGACEMAEVTTAVGTVTLARSRDSWEPVGDSLDMWASSEVQAWASEDPDRLDEVLAAARAAIKEIL